MRNSAARRRTAPTEPLKKVDSTAGAAPSQRDIKDDEENDEAEATGTSPIRFVVLFFGIPFLLLVVAGIVMTPCN
jgi:hypothetical protein